MQRLELKDLALPIIIGGLVFFIGYCGVYYMELRQPAGADPGIATGYWIVNDSPGYAFWFCGNHTAKEYQYDECVWEGTWMYEGENTYSLGPEYSDYLFRILPNGDMHQLNSGWVLTKNNRL